MANLLTSLTIRSIWGERFWVENTQRQERAYVCTIGGKMAGLMVKLVASYAFHFLRLCERVLPPSVLSLLLWPPASAWDFLYLRQRR